ncbi:MAG: hypothetical protein HQM02_12385 [Magnetococcales bacterium]|nr:hypothetical protein [Magnetococcales bacterium]
MSESTPHDPAIDAGPRQSPPPTPLQRPVVPNLIRMLAGRPLEEEILDPANPNLIVDRERE